MMFRQVFLKILALGSSAKSTILDIPWAKNTSLCLSHLFANADFLLKVLLFACLSSNDGQEGGNLQLHNVSNGSVLRKQHGVMI